MDQGCLPRGNRVVLSPQGCKAAVDLHEGHPGDFTIKHLCATFTTQSLPKVLVTENGSLFTTAELKTFHSEVWALPLLRCTLHPASNVFAKRAVQIFKEHIITMKSDSLQEKLAKFLLWYHLAPRSTTGVSPAELLMARKPRSKLDLLKTDLTDSVQRKQQIQKKNHEFQTLVVKKKVYINDLPRD